MRRTLSWVISLSAVLTVGYFTYQWLFPSDTRQIRTVLEKAAGAFTWHAGEGGLRKLMGPAVLTDVCTPDITVLLGDPTRPGPVRMIQSGQELRQAAVAMRNRAKALEIELIQVVIRVDPGRTNATAQVVASVRVNDSPEPQIQEARLQLRREDARWRIARVEPVKGFGM